MEVELNKSYKERIFHAILFEALANVIVSVLISKLLSVSLVQSSVLSIMSAATATLWNYIFNYFFDNIQRCYQFQRSVKVRIIHTCLFEIILIITLLPIAMYLLNLTVLDALSIEIGLALLFLPYTLIFNWTYDHIRWKLRGFRL